AFRFDGGATWLDLLATRGLSFSARPIERLTDPDRLADWLRQCELRPDQAPKPADLIRAQELRETLRTLALATVAGDPPPPVAVRALGQALRAPDPVRLAGKKRLRRKRPATTAEALTRIARQAFDQLTGPERRHLRVCAERDCRRVFADPAGRRRYCPASSCANRGRVRAHRERLRTP
ncbi:MAG TPA: CGNR zinc finger domain-containing protein, partial [Mycobacteriales bacterium]|nr:CGNR zinc finger domain-containing protein [Mycobacteriales bacterium]